MSGVGCRVGCGVFGNTVADFAELIWARLERYGRENEFFIDNLLVRIHLIIEMILVDRPCTRELKLPFPGSLISTFLGYCRCFSYQDSCLDVLSGDPRWDSGGAILDDLEEVGM